jgi:hypothetical protein
MKHASLSLAAASLLLPLAVVHAADPPPMPEGLWDVHTASTGNPGNKKDEYKYQLCRDHVYDKQATALAEKVPGCEMKSTMNADGTMTAVSRCTVVGTVIESKAVATYRGDSVHSESHATYTPAFMGKSDETDVMDQKYLGKCPAGMKPGDRIVDGVVQSR